MHARSTIDRGAGQASQSGSQRVVVHKGDVGGDFDGTSIVRSRLNAPGLVHDDTPVRGNDRRRQIGADERLSRTMKFDKEVSSMRVHLTEQFPHVYPRR